MRSILKRAVFVIMTSNFIVVPAFAFDPQESKSAAGDPRQLLAISRLDDLGVEVKASSDRRKIPVDMAILGDQVQVDKVPEILDLLSQLPTISSLQCGAQISGGDFSGLRKLVGVESVYMTDCKIGPSQMRALATLKRLSSLAIFRCEFAPGTGDSLKDLGQVKSLWISSSSGLSSEDYAFLPRMTRLSELTLGNEFARAENDPRLKFDDGAAEWLKGHPSIRMLGARGTDVSGRTLALFDTMPKLERVDVAETRITSSEASQYRALHPTLKIVD